MTTNLKKSLALRSCRTLALALAATLACGASFADKPEWAGNGGNGGNSNKGGKHAQKAQNESSNGPGHGPAHGPGQQQQGQPHMAQAPSAHSSRPGPRGGNVRVGGYFGDQQRSVVTHYYGNEFKAGRCPPGLAKKHNGCMPPGQAKKYTVGQRLPSNVVYYAVPQTVVYQLGAPPSGYRYVRVASDILLLAIGTSMVVDAIQNLSAY